MVVEGAISSLEKNELGFESTRVFQHGDAELQLDGTDDEGAWGGIQTENAKERSKKSDQVSIRLLFSPVPTI